MASLLSRPYVEVHNDRTTAKSSICDYYGAGGDASRLDLNVTMQTGATRADVDKILSNLVDDGENPVQISGMGDYASAAKDVVAALYGSTLVIAIDSNEPSGSSDLTTAELRSVVKAVVSAAG